MSASVTHQVDADGVGWIVFDHPTSRANIFDSATLAALETAVTELNAHASLRAIVITSAKDRIFMAGADLVELSRLPDPAAAAAYSVRGQKLFGRLQ